jgi:Flp pilus assembly protein TadD/mono/diheme cytochrome c family protein
MIRSLVFLLVLALSGCGRSAPPSTSATPTFNKDIAPILFANCTGCHRPGQGAPFTLLSYADAKSRADEIAHATTTRYMPPWLPDPGQPAFVGERRLSPEQIETIRRWAERGAAEGEARDLPAAPRIDTAWQLGTPDLVLTPAKAYALKLDPAGGDVFRNLVIRTGLDTDRFVRAVEFQPGGAPVHHAVLHLDRTAASRQRDGADGRPGFDGMGGPGTQEPDGHFVGWAPGRGPILSADGMAWRLSRGTDFVLELHLIPGATPIDVQPKVALFFSGAPSAKSPLMFKMGSNAIDIPAGATDYAITDRYVLPADVDLLSLYPHAHFLGKEMSVSATLPDGSKRSLLHIRQWSFHWQQDYQLVTPLALPRGTAIEMRFTYDNSDRNPDNPHHPPVRVEAGQRSTDEMGNLLLQLVPHGDADRLQLTRDVAARQAAANVAGAEALVRREPDNVENQIFLGSSYVDVGRVAEGIVCLERALRIDPRSSRAHNEMGGALLRAGRLADAVASFKRATSFAPGDARLHYNLGKAQNAAGAAADAAKSFDRAIALDAGLAEAHDELGVLLFARGQLREALGHLQRAVDLAPDSAIAHSDLGGALAQAGDYDRALVHVRRALELDPENAAAKENLARLRRR